MVREARVFIRNDSPWITRVCPNCGAHLNIDQPFCSQCGQEVSYENYHKVLDTGGCGLKLPPTWEECFIDDGMNRTFFIRQLGKLEARCRVKDTPELAVLRNDYIESCFGNNGTIGMDVFMRKLGELESLAGLKDSPILKIMREAYINTCREANI